MWCVDVPSAANACECGSIPLCINFNAIWTQGHTKKKLREGRWNINQLPNFEHPSLLPSAGIIVYGYVWGCGVIGKRGPYEAGQAEALNVVAEAGIYPLKGFQKLSIWIRLKILKVLDPVKILSIS